MTTGPYIVGETYKNVRVKITLINKAGQARQHWPLAVAMKAGELEIPLHYPDGRGVRRHFEVDLPRLGDEQSRLEAGKSVSVELALSDFGFRQLFEPGKYRAQLKFKSPYGDVTSFPWAFDVVEPDAADILASHTVPLDDFEAKRKADTLSQAFVQQIKLVGRVFLVYRSFGRGSKNAVVADRCTRLTELPGKVDMKVTGEFGLGKQITIVYEDKNEPDGKRTIIIDSKGG